MDEPFDEVDTRKVHASLDHDKVVGKVDIPHGTVVIEAPHPPSKSRRNSPTGGPPSFAFTQANQHYKDENQVKQSQRWNVYDNQSALADNLVESSSNTGRSMLSTPMKKEAANNLSLVSTPSTTNMSFDSPYNTPSPIQPTSRFEVSSNTYQPRFIASTATSSIAPRQPYTFRRTESDDTTARLIRKYAWRAEQIKVEKEQKARLEAEKAAAKEAALPVDVAFSHNSHYNYSNTYQCNEYEQQGDANNNNNDNFDDVVDDDGDDDEDDPMEDNKNPSLTPTPTPTERSSVSEDALQIRNNALKMLHLVDDKLKHPAEDRRVESGGHRASPSPSLGSTYSIRRTISGSVVEESNDPRDPYLVRRTASGTRTAHIPAALTGIHLNPSSSYRGRYSFTDREYRNDDHISPNEIDMEEENEEEDDILQPRTLPMSVSDDNEFNEERLVDVVQMENRVASPRCKSPTNLSDYDFRDQNLQEQSRNWSSRYLPEKTASYSTSCNLHDDTVDQMNSHDGARVSARNMMWSPSTPSIGEDDHSASGTVFGAGFSFRQNHVFGQQQRTSHTTQEEVNLAPVWQGSDHANSTLPPPPPVHKTWQEAMSAKRKRRRLVLALLLLIPCVVVIMVTFRLTDARARIARSRNQGVAGTPDLGSSFSFYVTSDVPYDKSEEDKISSDLANIPIDADFVVHLGNIQEAAVSLCSASRYSQVASLLERSPVPLFVLPGAQDWALCPNPGASWVDWKYSFESFDALFRHNFRVFRLRDRPENWCMMHKGVLLLGLHLVDKGTVDSDDWTDRHVDLLAFSHGMLKLHRDNFRAVVVLGNARPGPSQAEYFDGIVSTFHELEAPVAYIHANSGSGDTVREYLPFGGVDMLGIEIEDGGKNPPLRITVGHGERPFLVS